MGLERASHHSRNPVHLAGKQVQVIEVEYAVQVRGEYQARAVRGPGRIAVGSRRCYNGQRAAARRQHSVASWNSSVRRRERDVACAVGPEEGVGDLGPVGRPPGSEDLRAVIKGGEVHDAAVLWVEHRQIR